MPIPSNKEELLLSLFKEYEKLKLELESIPPELTSIEELDGHAKGTQISIKNLVSYLIGWGELVLKWSEHIELGKQIDFPDTGFKWNQLGLLAQKFYVDYGAYSYSALLELLDAVKDELVSLIESKENSDLYEQNWYTRYTLGRMIQLNTVSPYKNARLRIRKWKKEPHLLPYFSPVK